MADKVMDLSVQRVVIKDAHEFNAEVYVIATCLDDKGASAEDILNRAVLKGLVEENIQDGDKLTLGPGGLPCYSAKDDDVPSRVAWAIAVYESDRGVRDLGKQLEDISKDDRFKALATGAAALMTAGSVAAALTTLSTEILGIVGKILQFDKDDQLFLAQDYYDADLHQTSKPKTTIYPVLENENVRLRYRFVHLDKT
jgi:hypothetical protein